MQIESDFEVLLKIDFIQSQIDKNYLGNLLIECTKERNKIINPFNQKLAESKLAIIRGYAARADYGYKYFANTVRPIRDLHDEEIIQLATLGRAIHEICFGFEKLEESANLTDGGSTPVRFYINSIYHYLSSMFLIDKSNDSHKKLGNGGSVIFVLEPIGLRDLIRPINDIFNSDLAPGVKFGDLILKVRHSFLVHGKFYPSSTEYIVQQTNLRDPKQQERNTALLWDVFYQLLVFRLRILDVFHEMEIDYEAVGLRYLEKISSKKP
jgi:hypothetical protein